MVLAEGRNFHCSECHTSALCHQEMNCFSAALSDKPHCSSVCEHHPRDSDALQALSVQAAERLQF